MADDGAQDAWEGRAAAVLIWIAGVLFAVGPAFGFRDGGEGAWRLAGGLLELYGLLLGVWIRAWKWIEATGARTPGEWLRDAGRRALRALRRAWRRSMVRLGLASESGQTIGTVGTATETAEARGVGIVRGPPPERSLEERIEHLEERVEHQLGLISDVRREAVRRAQQLEDRLESVARDLRKSLRRLREDLEALVREAEVGSLRWEYVALAWFVVGVLVTTWAGVLPGPPVPG